MAWNRMGKSKKKEVPDWRLDYRFWRFNQIFRKYL